MKYYRVETAFGDIGFGGPTDGDTLTRIYLPNEVARDESDFIRLSDSEPSSAPKWARFMAGAMNRYFVGINPGFRFDILDLTLASDFEKCVYRYVFSVGWGATVSYNDVATAVDRPGAARAVGGAMARNPFPIAIPCHRVLRKNGGIGGYRGGIKIKNELLRLERKPLSPA